jgi:oxygen-independent coproporphyrinogen-3 oxidase
MHRAHNASEAESCVKAAQDVGFRNMTIDLIYALPAPDHRLWEADIAQALALSVPHISAYCLTIEPQTVFGKWLKNKKIHPIDDDFAAEQFLMLAEALEKAAYEHYEVSNFAREGFYSRHNANYWKKGTYLGIGPSAHSYNGKERAYSVANNSRYMADLEQGTLPLTVEQLTTNDHINEYLMTSLRTRWGCDTRLLAEQFGYDLLNDPAAMQYIGECQKNGLMYFDQHHLLLTKKGKLLADEIAAHLFLTD